MATFRSVQWTSDICENGWPEPKSKPNSWKMHKFWENMTFFFLQLNEEKRLILKKRFCSVFRNFKIIFETSSTKLKFWVLLDSNYINLTWSTLQKIKLSLILNRSHIKILRWLPSWWVDPNIEKSGKNEGYFFMW